MATTKQPQPISPRQRKWRWARRGMLALAVLLVVPGVVMGPGLLRLARTASAYGARMGCACHYVEGRPLKDCTRDFEPGMRPVWLSEDAPAHRITARYGPIAAQSASWQPGPGCVLESWR